MVNIPEPAKLTVEEMSMALSDATSRTDQLLMSIKHIFEVAIDCRMVNDLVVKGRESLRRESTLWTSHKAECSKDLGNSRASEIISSTIECVCTALVDHVSKLSLEDCELMGGRSRETFVSEVRGIVDSWKGAGAGAEDRSTKPNDLPSSEHPTK
jgi:hypothetical protein